MWLQAYIAQPPITNHPPASTSFCPLVPIPTCTVVPARSTNPCMLITADSANGRWHVLIMHAHLKFVHVCEGVCIAHGYVFLLRARGIIWSLSSQLIDHHCPWVNNCIGHFNYAHFIRFLFFVDITCTYHLWMLTALAFGTFNGTQGYWVGQIFLCFSTWPLLYSELIFFFQQFRLNCLPRSWSSSSSIMLHAFQSYWGWVDSGQSLTRSKIPV